MIFKRVAFLVGLITCLVSASGLAQKAGQLGDPAPALTVGEWIKGKPVKFEAGTNFYVVVFCQLTRAGELAITNLDLLQKDYQDKGLVTVIISEDAPEVLKQFVMLHADELNFTVAADDLASRTKANYQRVFNQFRSPLAYVVDKKGRVVWFGHPLTENLGEVVDQIAADKFDLTAEKREVREQRDMDAYLMLARQDDPRTEKAGQMLLAARTNNASALFNMAEHIAKDPYLDHRDVALATEALDQAGQISSTNAIGIALDRAVLVFQTGKQQEGLAMAKQALANAKTDDEKKDADLDVRVMQTRIAAPKDSTTNAAPANP